MDEQRYDLVLEIAQLEEIFSSKKTPLRRRIVAGFLYHPGLSKRRIDRSSSYLKGLFTTVLSADTPVRTLTLPSIVGSGPENEA